MARAFLDTNVLLYLLGSDSTKADRAEELLVGGGLISVQVLNEFATIAHRKANLPWPEILTILATLRTACQVVPLTVELHEEGLAIAQRYRFSLYDSLIVAAALGSGCTTLYSEDLQDGQVIESLTIINPFGSRCPEA